MIRTHPMSFLRRALTLIAGLAMVVSLAACGRDEPDAEVDPGIGQVERTETMDGLGMALVTNGDGVARFVGTLVNQADEPDRLIGVEVVTDIGAHDLVIADGPVILPPDEPVTLARDAHMFLVSEVLRPGYRADVRMVFSISPPLETTLPVEENVGPYAEVEVVNPLDGDISPDDLGTPSDE